MGLNDTPSGERLQIAIFGRINAGKSSLINAITGQNLAIVSEQRGTTTDPVYKAMELLPIGPVMFVDTPGLDDVGELGKKRMEKTMQVLRKSHMALLVLDCAVAGEEYSRGADGAMLPERRMVQSLRENGIPYVIVFNKADTPQSPEEMAAWAACLQGEDVEATAGDTKRQAEAAKRQESVAEENSTAVVETSAKTGAGIEALKDAMVHVVPESAKESCIIRDKLHPGDVAVLVVPIDSAAPKGRLILPQQQTIRDILEAGAVCMVTRETELAATLRELKRKPDVVITDSQAFGKVAKDTPEDVLLTSFSILFARYKGNLRLLVEGVKTLDSLQDGDKVLIAEGCTHRRQCEDIGTVKIPKWLRDYTGRALQIETCSGTEFPEDLEKYALIVHCGACTLNPKEMQYRMQTARQRGIPMVNYGILIAHVHGILRRSLEIFPEIHGLLD